MGGARAPAGIAPRHNSRPVATSKARRKWSIAAPMNAMPLAVTIGPPRVGGPSGVFEMAAGWGRSVAGSPSGTSHAFAPVSRLIPTSAPHGGGVHGNPLGAFRSPPRHTHAVAPA